MYNLIDSFESIEPNWVYDMKFIRDSNFGDIDLLIDLRTVLSIYIESRNQSYDKEK